MYVLSVILFVFLKSLALSERGCNPFSDRTRNVLTTNESYKRKTDGWVKNHKGFHSKTDSLNCSSEVISYIYFKCKTSQSKLQSSNFLLFFFHLDFHRKVLRLVIFLGNSIFFYHLTFNWQTEMMSLINRKKLDMEFTWLHIQINEMLND